MILSLPLVAMQFTDEVVWSLWDFVVVGVLLAIIGVAHRAGSEEGGQALRMAVGIAALGVACWRHRAWRMTRPASCSSASCSSAARVRSG